MMAFRRNGGSGTARRIGTQEARGGIVVWTDADMTYPNERIPELVQPWSRRTRPTTRWSVPAPPSRARTAAAGAGEVGDPQDRRAPHQHPIPDLNSGLRAFRRDVSLPYLRLLPPGFSCVTTITIAFLHNQHGVRYLPIDYAKRSGTSKFHLARGRVPLHPSGAPDGDVLQPAEAPDAARAVATRHRDRQSGVRRDRPPVALRDQHHPHLPHRGRSSRRWRCWPT